MTLIVLWSCGCSSPLRAQREIVTEDKQDRRRIHDAAEQFEGQLHQTEAADGRRTPLEIAAGALASGQWEAARDQLQGYIQDEQTDRVAAVSAAVLPLRHAQPEMAFEVAMAVLYRFGPSGELMRVIGTVHYRLGDYQKAQTAFQESLSLDSANPLTYLLMSFTLEKLGDQQAADQFFQRGCQLDPLVASWR
jgi:Tfp pilus assembly protein PilF